MASIDFVGLDVHKKTIAYCGKDVSGEVLYEGTIAATRLALAEWVGQRERPWVAVMEATLFTGWIYDALKPHAQELKVAHPLMLRWIAAGKKKSDRIDAARLADLLRCDLVPECYMAPRAIRDLRRVLRFRNLVMRQAVRMKNKMAGLLMEIGQEYTKSRLHGKRYFAELLDSLEEVPECVVELLRLSRGGFEFFETMQARLLSGLHHHPDLEARVERLMTIRGVGQVTALTWALEVADPHRFSSIRNAVSYCGLCSSLDQSAGKLKRAPISKQRNAHLQTVLVEAAKLAPRWNEQLAAVYERERAQGSSQNRATLAVARKLVAYLLAVDKAGRDFEPREAQTTQEPAAA